MGVIAQTVLGPAQKVKLADESFAKLPNLMASILALSRMGVGLEVLEVTLHILFVTFQAMNRSDHAWPILSEHVQDSCTQRVTAHARFVKTACAGLHQDGTVGRSLLENCHRSVAQRAAPSSTCSRTAASRRRSVPQAKADESTPLPDRSGLSPEADEAESRCRGSERPMVIF
jgi:hypothetical protein